MRAAGRQGDVKVIGFDEDPVTLRGIADGVVQATVVQQPYEFGYQSMKLLARLHRGRQVVRARANELMIVPTKVIDKLNVAEFQTTMKELLKK